ncbi:nitrous oxide reductase family maturation protein NosD [Sedimenticola selenatireducens]|uniref:nitrous oxide reductase family maturation protein NosD n=1 Tax=Sedimenticola selenatireducens TaxID=191960 RepID=UPI00048AB611|nr:nitrous oxide reductase family maturation protein NosD [Sedimenticola selenatireducens]
MKRLWLMLCLLAGCLVSTLGYALPPLQLFVDITPPGGVLTLPAGSYAGPVVIRRPIIIDGRGEVTVDGEGGGTVVTVLADGVTIRGLHLTNSGHSHDQVDAALLLAADDALVEDNRMDDVLFGIHIRQANGNVVRNNRIESRAEEPSLRGEGIRVWYSSDNLMEGNHITQVRDVVFTNSSDNRFIGNTIENSRIGMELIFSPDNEIAENTLIRNTTGIVLIYSNGVVIRENRLLNMPDATSSALAVKESSQVRLEANDIVRCAVGLTANSPTDPENIIYLTNNHFAYNDVAMYFYGEKGGHIIHGNRFTGNIIPIAVSAASSALDNDWRGNAWDTYEGFDRDLDGTGDTPHNIYLYSDRLWMDRPMARFFRGSPVLEMVDFIERLAPFSMPDLILSDPSPRMH